MLNRLIRCGLLPVAATVAVFATPALAQSTSDVAGQIASTLPDNGRGQITASGLRSVLNAMNARSLTPTVPGRKAVEQGDGSDLSVTPSASAAAGTLGRTLYGPTFGAVTINGDQSLSYSGVGAPPGGITSSQIINIPKKSSELFELGTQWNCTTDKGASHVGNADHYLGEMVCGGFGMKINAGSGGGYAFTTVVETAPGISGMPVAGYENDVNHNGAHCGDVDGPVAGGLFVAPCDSIFLSGAGSKRLRSIISMDLAGANSTIDSGFGLKANRGIAMLNGSFRLGAIEIFANAKQALRVGSTMSDSIIDIADAVTPGNVAIKLPRLGALNWRSGNGTTLQPLVTQDTADRLVLGGGYVTRVQPLAAVNLFVQPTNSANGVTLASANDANSAAQPMTLTGSQVNILTTAGMYVNLDGTTRQVIVGPTNSCGANYRCLFTPN